MMLEEIRQKYPQYSDLADADLADAIYAKHYSDMDRAAFDKAIGMSVPDRIDEFTGGEGLPEGREFTDPLQMQRDAIGMGVMDPFMGAGQLLFNNLPQSAIDSRNALASMWGGTPTTGESYNQMLLGREQQYQADRAANEAPGFDYDRLAGNVLSTAPVAAMGGPTVAGGAISGAGIGLTTPQVEGDFSNEETLGNVALGGVGGGGGNALMRGASSVFAPVSANLKRLLDAGVTPTIGQRLGGFANVAEQWLSRPVLWAAANARGRAAQDFNRAVYADVLGSIGSPPPMTVGHEAVAQVKNTISEAYNEMLPNVTFTADAQFARDFSNLYGLAQNLPDKELRQFENIVEQHLGPALTGGSMDGQSFKALESSLTNDIGNFINSGDAYQRQLGTALRELRDILRGGLARSNSGVMFNGVDVGQRLSDINLAWAKLQTLERAASYVGAEEGVFTANQFLSAVRGKSGEDSFSTGGGLMQDLAVAGKSVLGDSVPNSGTPERMLPWLIGGGAIDPNFVLGAGLLNIPYTRSGTGLLNSAMNQRQRVVSPAAQTMLRDAAPLMGLLGATAATE